MVRNGLIALAIVVLIGIALFQNQTGKRDETLPEEGFRAPDVVLETLDGETVALSGLIGKKVIINFWASWCYPCEQEAPELVEMYEKYRGEVEVLAVNMTNVDTVEDASQFAGKYGFEFPILLDKKGLVSEAYQVLSIPTTFFVATDGTIEKKVLGFHGPKTFREQIESFVR